MLVPDLHGRCESNFTGVSYIQKAPSTQETLMSDDLNGQIVAGEYLLEGLVGEGSMGRVFSGRTLDTQDRVAIKILHTHLQKRQDFRERFELEAKALSRLAHPSFSKIHESGHDDELDLDFMVLEFIDGVNAAKRMETPISVDEACVIALQVSEALLEAHSQGVLHRDLKPENIMVSGDDPPVVKLLDLGLAKLFDTDPDESTDVLKRRRNLTKAGEVFGTPAYMSPEMCLGTRDVSASSDLYSLGLILFEMVEGKPVFSGTPVKISMDQVETSPPAMSPDVPVDIARLVAWMLQKEPADRPQSANQVSEILRKHVAGTRPIAETPVVTNPVVAPLETAPPLTATAEGATSAAGRTPIFVGLLVVGVLALVIAWLLR